MIFPQSQRSHLNSLRESAQGKVLTRLETLHHLSYTYANAAKSSLRIILHMKTTIIQFL